MTTHTLHISAPHPGDVNEHLYCVAYQHLLQPHQGTYSYPPTTLGSLHLPKK